MFAFWVIFHAVVVVCQFFFSRKYSFGPDLGSNVSKGYQQTTKLAAGKERVEYHFPIMNGLVHFQI